MSAISALLLSLTAAIAVIDGDTFDVGDERVRIANIDAPELHRAKCDAEKRLAELARKRLEELLAGDIEIVPGDPGTGRTKDRHGRTLATIKSGGADIGELMIAEGLVRPWEGKRRPWCTKD
ncbi:thermonuclease family protein [Ensifer sp. LCM 4579]|uniref:thermonuclease family protein n=1 Tax=Ensifer sp. LCM 4579 TaxID=1848292 RepID=UPI0008DA80FE|nr:thermonuclease family protein [Ensifer sp. LCM 4579]OHV73358.1 hypothetical protein LCM4579_10580 [Ensifer sp. LCM 4579]